jgi:putative intracellular protease/amidase
MSGDINVTNPDQPKRILMVIANASVSTTLGIPVGFWGAELTHAWYAFTEVGYDVTVACPDGGKCELDAWSDPRDESRYSFGHLITMGFLNTPEYMTLIEQTPALGELDYDGYFKPFAVRDGRLITGQQQFSGEEVARLVIEAVGS